MGTGPRCCVLRSPGFWSVPGLWQHARVGCSKYLTLMLVHVPSRPHFLLCLLGASCWKEDHIGAPHNPNSNTSLNIFSTPRAWPTVPLSLPPPRSLYIPVSDMSSRSTMNRVHPSPKHLGPQRKGVGLGGNCPRRAGHTTRVIRRRVGRTCR